MRFLGPAGPRWIRWAGLAAVLGGVLWIPYGVFEMLEPWGVDAVYRDDPGYSVITDAALYRTYSLPGGLASLLTSLGLFGVFALLKLPVGRTGKIGLLFIYLAVVLSALSLVGVAVMFDPLFTAPRIFGSLALGIATLLAGLDARKTGAGAGWIAALLVLGLAGMFLLPLWPLVFAIQVLSEAAGAAFMTLFGLGWLATGYRLWLAPR